MRFLIIGGNGFIGHHLCKRLDDLGFLYDVYDIGKPNGNPSKEVIQKRIELSKKSLESISPYLHYDYVIHLGSLAGVRSSHHPNEYYKDNVYDLQEFFENHGNFRQFVYISSSSVFGDIETAYSLSKKIAEKIVRKVPKSLIIRPFTVYGENGRPDLLINKCILGEKIIVNGDPKKLKRKFTYVGDLVDCIIKNLGYIGFVNAIGEKEYSVQDVLDIFKVGYEIGPEDPRDFKIQTLPENEKYFVCKTKIEDVLYKLGGLR